MKAKRTLRGKACIFTSNVIGARKICTIWFLVHCGLVHLKSDAITSVDSSLHYTLVNAVG